MVNGRLLLKRLQSANVAEQSWGVGFIMGVAEGRNQIDPGGLCFDVPGNTVSGLQLKQMVERYLTSYPATLHERAATLVSVALASKYPCRP